MSYDSFKFLSKKSSNSSQTKSITNDTNLNIYLPKPHLPKFASVFNINGNAKINISGKKKTNNQTSNNNTNKKKRFRVSLDFPVEIKLKSFRKKLKANIDLDKVREGIYEINIPHKGTWNAPFGIKGLKIKDGDFFARLKGSNNNRSSKTPQGKKGAKSGDFTFSGSAKFGKLSSLPIKAMFINKNGSFVFSYFELDKKISLSDIPFEKNIPHSKKFKLEDIKLSLGGISAKTLFNKTKVKAFVFKSANNDGYNLALEQNNFKFGELVKDFKKIKPLNKIKLPKVALIFSEKGFSSKKEDIKEPANELFDTIFTIDKFNVSIPKGISLFTPFYKKDFGIIGDGFSKIGVSEGSIVSGGISGLFGGDIGLSLKVWTNKTKKADGVPNKVFKFPLKVPNFYITLMADQLDVGAETDLNVVVKKQKLLFESKFGLDFTDKGVGIDVTGKLNGKWKKPFGIEFLTLSNVVLTAGIKDTGEVNIGFGGDSKFGDTKFNLDANIDILLEDALPDGVAFKAKANKIGVKELIDIATALLKLKNKIDIKSIPFFEIHDAVLAFATPGANDPDLGLITNGFAIKGKYFFGGKELGIIKGVLAKDYIVFSGDIADINLDILTFKNNKVNFKLGAFSDFKIDSFIKFLGADENITLDLNPPKLNFKVTSNLGEFGSGELDVSIDGFDLKTGKFDPKADFSILGEFKSNLALWLDKEVKNGLRDIKKSANNRFKSATNKLNDAEKKVKDINKKIAKIRAQDNRRKQRAEDKIKKAQRKVDHFYGKYKHANHEAHHCGNKWTHWACKGFWYGVRDVDWALYKSAKAILEAVKKTVAAAFELDPRLEALHGARSLALDALAVAKAVVKTDEEAIDFVINNLDKLVKDMIKTPPFEIKQAMLMGDLRGVIKKDLPLILDIEFVVGPKTYREYFAIKLKDLDYDAKSFALIPILVLDYGVKKALKTEQKAIRTWLEAHMATLIAVTEDTIRKDIKGLEAKYLKILKTYEKNSKKFKEAYENLDKKRSKIIKKFKITDLMPDSLEFRDKYLAIGHSNLCLGVENNSLNVIQKNCKDSDTELWSTQKADQNGYVFLKARGLCLKARSINPSINNGEFLALGECSGDEHSKWKVENYDNFYISLVNKFSQKCLHFNIENANPKTAYGIWTSCMGADSQTFRAINDAQKPTHHDINSKVAARNGWCIGSRNDFDQIYEEIEEVGGVNYYNSNYLKFQNMLNSKINLLISVDCNDKNAIKFNYTEKPNGDIKLFSSKQGLCVVRSYFSNELLLMPCDRGEDMVWEVKPVGKDGFNLYNKHYNKCINIQSSKGVAVHLESCTVKHSQKLYFKK